MNILRQLALAGTCASLLLCGCGSEEKETERAYRTSGSREADQRAEQRMAREEQILGKEREQDTRTLYERLGGEQGVTDIVDDFLDRAIADPRVNWERKGVTSGGITEFRRKRSEEWKATDQNVARLRKHMVQFLSLATGGPSEYQGRDMRAAHRGMEITNAEFDAAIGDLKATLDALKYPAPEQKELIAILESTRPQVVTEK